jgi:cytochrome b subunit of formate dehydrogenase
MYEDVWLNFSLLQLSFYDPLFTINDSRYVTRVVFQSLMIHDIIMGSTGIIMEFDGKMEYHGGWGFFKIKAVIRALHVFNIMCMFQSHVFFTFEERYCAPRD